MIIIGIVLAFIGLAYLCWLVFALAVYALPFFADATVHRRACHLSQRFGTDRSDHRRRDNQRHYPHCRADRLYDPPVTLIRAAIALLFAVPAAVAGYHGALGLAHIGIPAESWKQAIAMAGAIVVAATAWARMMLSAPRPTPDKALPPA